MEPMAGQVAKKVFFCVTGGAAGISLSTAKTLLSRGAAVSICDVQEEKFRDAYDSLKNPMR